VKNSQLGSVVLGIIIGVVVGLAVALAVAVYVTKVPVPFLNRGQSRTAEQDAAETRKNRDWDPNAPLYGKNPAKPLPPAPGVVVPAPPVATIPGPAPLPAPGDLEHAGAFGTHDDDAVGRIAAMIGEDRERIRIRLAELLKVSTPSELDRTIAEHEGELVYLVLADRAFADRLRREDAAAAFPLTIKTAGVTGELEARLSA